MVTMLVKFLYIQYNKLSLKLHLLNNTLLKPYVLRRGKGFSVSNILEFRIVAFFTLLGFAEKIYKKRTLLRAKLYFRASERLENCLDVRTMIVNSRDIKLFHKLMIRDSQEKIIQELETKGLIEGHDFIKSSIDQDRKYIFNNMEKEKRRERARKKLLQK